MTPETFQDLVAPHRRELAAYCYRMLGSLADAEDQVQETLLRAWRGIDGFEGRASVRSWLYKIATNTCLDALRARPRRGLPTETGAPIVPGAELPPVDPEIVWLSPAPASLLDTHITRESVRLAFLTALQHLPAQQRAAVILRDVVGWSATEVAELLDTTVAGVNSALQRGRETLEARRGRPPAALDDTARAALLARYIQVWESGDADALAALLHDDVVSSMPPIPGILIGRDVLVEFIRPRLARNPKRVVLVDGVDDAAFAFYSRKEGADVYSAHAIQIVTFDGPLVREIHAFIDDAEFARWGLPPILR
jgi:RNA polymerase sigma-70 factor (ECF subfamily)